MKNRYITYKDVEELRKEFDPQYMILFSARNDGKSYAAKESVLRRFWEKGEQFTYLRRQDIDIRRADQSLYWADFLGLDNKVEEITGGAWSEIIADKDGFSLAKVDEATGKMMKGPLIGYIHALSVAGKAYKSLQFPDVHTIIYEEFVTAEGYLFNEADRLQQYVSTVFRDRSDVCCVMIGNKITRLNPYFRQWQLNGIFKMEPGQTDVYDFREPDEETGEETTTRIIVHEPATAGKVKGGKSMFFGASAGMIKGHSYDVKDQPRLRDRRREYDARYEVVVDIGAAGGRFLLTFLQHRIRRDEVVWYVEPKTSKPQEKTRLIGPDYVPGPYWTKDFTPLSDGERKAFQQLRYGRIVYSDNLTGTEFKRAMRQLSIPEKED